MSTRTPIDPRSAGAADGGSSPITKPVAALFAVVRKILGKAEDKRETIHRGAWELCVQVEPDPIDGGFIAECPTYPAR
jgi:hypothetical protein